MQVATIRGVLSYGDTPSALYSALERKWKVPPQSADESRRTRTSFDIEVGAAAESGASILSFLASLISRRSIGLDHLILAVVSGAGGVDLVHSLFLVNASKYDKDLPEVWGIVGEIPEEGFLTLAKLTFISEFEAHVTSLSSIKPRNFDSNAHQPAVGEAEGSHPISSRGAAFLPAAAALTILDLGAEASIAEVAQHVFPIINDSETTSFDAPSDWLQASFTSQSDDAYVLGPILTRCHLPVVNTTEGSFCHTVTVQHLQLSFLGQYFPRSPPSTTRIITQDDPEDSTIDSPAPTNPIEPPVTPKTRMSLGYHHPP